MQVDTSLPFEIELIREIRCKAAGPDGLSPSFLKYGGEVSTSELPEILGSIQRREEIPKDCSESVIVQIYNKVDGSYVKTTKELV